MKRLFVLQGDGIGASSRSSSQHLPDMIITVVVIVVIMVVFLMIIDFSCYFMNSCGVTMFICVHCCGQQHPHNSERAIDEAER